MDSIEVLIARARSLVQMKKYDQAIAELHKALIIEPENIDALLLLTIIYIQKDDEQKLDEYTQKLLAAAPDYSIAYYYRAIYFKQIENDSQSEAFIRKAIELEPWCADYFGLLSAIYIDRKKWETGLEYANEGLKADPENTTCLNYRTICLTKLNRLDELDSNIEETLAQNPEDAYSHANIGWSKLETGNLKDARTHFWEALKLNPDNYQAKEGMKEIVRAKNPIYRFFLNYQFWIAKQQNNLQWFFILGVYFGTKFIGKLASSFPILWIPYFILITFAYLTWIIEPFANIFLRFDSFGKYALDDDEKTAANITAICLLLGIISVAAYISLDYYVLLGCAIFAFTIVIPLSRYYSLSERKRKGFITYYTIALTVIGLLAIAIGFVDERIMETIGTVYLVGFIAYQWIINYIALK
jgi:tetratricopeptide (TPR) repeat protein